MKKTTRIVLAVLIAAALLGGYLIVAGNTSTAKEPSADTPSVFLH